MSTMEEVHHLHSNKVTDLCCFNNNDHSNHNNNNHNNNNNYKNKLKTND